MLSKDKIILIFCLIDDILQGIDHKEDVLVIVKLF
ncbi:hypothetical protein FLACOL_01721 [Flavobacterium columnare]|uniref:Uncharacterized protein n=1 Tax=Flavobacterium columnare TaxID=996 RepID=A0A2N9PBJ3_9FLAO|nr:hypothetical protein FLACOL_01721 [Flavobacterium columnare]